MTNPAPKDPRQLAMPLDAHQPGYRTERDASRRGRRNAQALAPRVIAFLRERGPVGATKHEVDDAFHLVDAQSSRLLYLLRKAGTAVLLNETRRMVAGGPEAHVCVLTEFVNARPLAQKVRQ